MIQAILFNLEGTLTNLDSAKFMQNYLGILAPRFAHLLPTDKFTKLLLKSMELIQNDPKPELTVLQAFLDEFSRVSGHPIQVLRPIFEEFYVSDFPTLRCLVQPNTQGVKSVEYAIQQGFSTAIVSSPLMPLAAVEEQVRWAGLRPEQLKVIAALDNFHYCKPQMGFFQEVSEKLGIRPQGCLLVSNNENDMICRGLGMKTFFLGTTDSTILTDYAGQFEDLFRLISQGSL
ncbi:putative HAD superfamily hydrolase [Desulfosporosinus orientis DSM 765]|uniref:Putative HAD superfamily hydrolase n=1 Tax=Desulfosporosinus orientis (strain ATCC 19365 / DSM 765 / NCIMB 8382 / VKM B-1628 / Singapore I) TaxID=768706 RepID=G7WFS5_DESOD|nr:HAD family hydrolase [Desulfosporosinus orientis]AET68948.1 putative HAD superfamily hydrolase [Desulfosporosinus orientis DSM 765]